MAKDTPLPLSLCSFTAEVWHTANSRYIRDLITQHQHSSKQLLNAAERTKTYTM